MKAIEACLPCEILISKRTLMQGKTKKMSGAVLTDTRNWRNVTILF